MNAMRLSVNTLGNSVPLIKEYNFPVPDKNRAHPKSLETFLATLTASAAALCVFSDSSLPIISQAIDFGRSCCRDVFMPFFLKRTAERINFTNHIDNSSTHLWLPSDQKSSLRLAPKDSTTLLTSSAMFSSEKDSVNRDPSELISLI
ncbi:hypothetical protein TNCV_1097871 [Trichonephila clavipes]|nr:hypothetical protein TNCV_1097871 [Trichonephila clavipes]